MTSSLDARVLVLECLQNSTFYLTHAPKESSMNSTYKSNFYVYYAKICTKKENCKKEEHTFTFTSNYIFVFTDVFSSIVSRSKN